MRLWRDRHLHLSITRLGLEYLAALLLVGAFAANTGNNLLYLVFALMVALLLVSGWTSRSALRNFAPLAVEEGNLFARVKGGIRIRFKDGAPKRVRALEVRLELEQGFAEPAFFAGGGGDPEPRVVLHARPERRGPCRLTGLEVRTRYPFGFLEKAWRFDLDENLLVLPHPRVVVLRQAQRGEAPRSLPRPGSSSPEGARPFRAGDPLTRVHWKRTAQRGAPWVRTFEDEAPLGLHLRLDLGAWAPGRAFEEELERLSGAVLQARIQKRSASLEIRSPQGRRELEGHVPCWRALATAQAQGADFSASGAASSGPILATASALP